MLAQELQKYKQQILPHRKKCVVGRWMDELPKEDAEAFEEAVADRDYNDVVLTQIANAHGGKFRKDSTRRHRNGQCSCQN